MSEDGEMWAAYRAGRQAKRASNRAQAGSQLRAVPGLKVTTANCGAHYVITEPLRVIDFWPGTGLWMVRGSTERHYGIRNLVRFITDGAKP